ncbi:MAG TPA: hypothetical protein PLP42_00450 [Acidobacteriota bacterium]|nr:hypothetical protein [Acidobacteriota bacterium]
MWEQVLALGSLFFFTMASAGFVLVIIRYPFGSNLRVWGIRFCHALGFVGVILMRLSRGSFSDASLLVVSSLIVSFLSFEMSRKYLKQPPQR